MKEQISTLMDGEYAPEEAEHVFTALCASDELRERWSTYHLIGDSLRGAAGWGTALEQRVMERLEAEPTVLAPRPAARRKPSHLWSAAASVAAVMFVGWVALQQMQTAQDNVAAPSLAANSAAPATGNSVSPESLNSYLLAHHELSPDSGMQTAYYVRPVAFAGNGN